MAQLQQTMEADAYRLLELLDEAYEGRNDTLFVGGRDITEFITRCANKHELLDIDIANVGIAMNPDQPLDINRVTNALVRLWQLGIVTERGQSVRYNGLDHYLRYVDSSLWVLTLAVTFHTDALEDAVQMLSTAAAA
jgi:hypothetical protein